MTLKHIQNSLSYWCGVAFIGIVFGIGLQFVSAAWTEPTIAPPGGNIAGPINIGSIGQWKEAALAINTGWDTNGDGTPDTVATNGLLIPNGFVGIGTIAPSAELEINGKGKSQSTVAGDAGNTLVTKDYVDALGTGGSGPRRNFSGLSLKQVTKVGGNATCGNASLYGVCFKEILDTCAGAVGCFDQTVAIPSNMNVDSPARVINVPSGVQAIEIEFINAGGSNINPSDSVFPIVFNNVELYKADIESNGYTNFFKILLPLPSGGGALRIKSNNAAYFYKVNVEFLTT